MTRVLAAELAFAAQCELAEGPAGSTPWSACPSARSAPHAGRNRTAAVLVRRLTEPRLTGSGGAPDLTRRHRAEELHPGRRAGFFYVYLDLGVARQAEVVPDDGFVDERRRDDAEAGPAVLHRSLITEPPPAVP